jgi:tetraacyldisaccharide 4'-kinase
VSGESVDRESAARVPVLIFAGLGDPASFRKSVEEFGCMVSGTLFFLDHHWYTVADLSRLRNEARRKDVKMMVTTRKDLMRIRSLGTVGEEFLEGSHVFVLEIDTTFIAGEDAIDRLIDKVAR